MRKSELRKSELPISNPCDEDWGGMRRDPGARRFCDQCSKHVHDLTSMTEDEARDVLAQAGGERICVRYRVDGSGALRFREPAQKTQIEPTLVPVAALRRRGAPSRVAPIAAAPAAVLAVALAACTPHGEAEEPEAIEVIEVIEVIEANEADPEEHVLMGDIMPVEMGDESGGEEQPCDPEATDPTEVEMMGDVAWEPELEGDPEPKPEPEPKPQVIMGRIPPKR